MIEVTWTEDIFHPILGQDQTQCSRWFNDRKTAEQWASDSFMPGEWNLVERPGQLNWRATSDTTWVAQYQQVNYQIRRSCIGWCKVVAVNEFRYNVAIDGECIVMKDGEPCEFTSLEAAMGACEYEAFDEQ